jgi:UDP-glucose 4-epimerase
MKILIAGGSGFIGSHLLPALVSAGHETYNIIRSVDSHLPTGVIPIVGDLRQMETLSIPKADVVVHLAQSNIRFPEGAEDLLMINCVSAVRLALLAIAHGAQKFIYCSTGNVYGGAEGPVCESAPLLGGSFYAESKIAAERMLGELKQRISLDILRVFSPYGPGQQPFRLIPDVVRRVQESRAVFIRASGKPVLSPLYVDDAVAGILSCVAAQDSTILNLAGDEAVTIEDIARQTGSIMKREPVFEMVNDGMSGGPFANNEKFRTLLGRACIPLTSGLESYISWLRNRA